MSKAFRYKHISARILETQVDTDEKRVSWIEDFLNSVGSKGVRIVGYPIMNAEPSAIRTADNRALMNLIITVLTEELYTPTAPTPEFST
jgi:hypothetical protein